MRASIGATISTGTSRSNRRWTGFAPEEAGVETLRLFSERAERSIKRKRRPKAPLQTCKSLPSSSEAQPVFQLDLDYRDLRLRPRPIFLASCERAAA